MTSAELLAVVLRRWYVVVAVLAVCGCGFIALLRTGGTYTVDMNVQLVAPESEAISPSNDWQQETLVNFAAIIEEAFHGWHDADRVAESASLFGSGVDQGYQVLLLNLGGQWEESYPKPTLAIRVVGPSEAWVLKTTDEILDRIDRLVSNLQDDRSVDEDQRIFAERIPSQPTAGFIGHSGATTLRAAGAFGLVSLSLAALAAVLVDAPRRQRDTPLSARPKSLLPTREGTA